MLAGAVYVGPDSAAVADEAARRFVQAARASIAARGRFDVALAGGNTPRALYQRLARPPRTEEIEWPRVHLFFGDERCVPPDDARSNFRMAREALLDHVTGAKMHRMRGELPPADGARDYERVLNEQLPDGRFDLVLLGVGADGHTASLFPHQPALSERVRRTVWAHVPAQPPDRLTLTLPVLDAAARVFLLVCGRDKARVLGIVRRAPADPGPLADEHPVLHVRASGEMQWFLDEAAASG